MKYEFYSKAILKDKSLSDATKCVANHLIHISGWEEDNLLPSNSKLSEILSIDRKTIRQAIRTLTQKGYIIVNDDNTFTFNINGVRFTKQNLKDPSICHSLGDFVKVPSYLNYINTITPSARIAAIQFFEFNFGIKGNSVYVKKDKPSIDAVATYYGINKSTFKSRIQKCKEAEIFEYAVVQDGCEKKKIVGLKNIEWIKTWVRLDKLSDKTKKLQEEAQIEAVKEEIVKITITEEQKAEIEKLEKILKPAFRLQYETSVKDRYDADYTISWLRKRVRG